jgi:hypothetical protein
MATREHRVVRNLRSVGRFRRVNFGRNDSKLFLKHPEYRRMLLRAARDMDEGKGIHMSVEELRQLFGIEP